jgi:hypothetical protein
MPPKEITLEVVREIVHQEVAKQLREKDGAGMELAVMDKVYKHVYKNVMTEINTSLVPKVEKTLQYVHSQTFDGAELVHAYRTRVHNGGNKTITNGGNMKYISPNVSLLFADE